MTRIVTRYFPLWLIGIGIGAAAVRSGGLGWLAEAAPFPGYSFHPDVMRFIEPLADFENFDVWAGYPVGFTAQLFLVHAALASVGVDAYPLTVLTGISLAYGLALIVLTGWLARWLSGSAPVGLLAAALLALAPLHVVNSLFATPDGAAVFFLYVALIFGWRSLAYRRDLDFVLFAASIGVGMALKFYFPLLVPLALVAWQLPRPLERSLVAALVLAGSFSLANFFNYTPWDLAELLRVLVDDNLDIEQGHAPPAQLALYGWDTVRALGLGTWLLFVVGTVAAARRGWRVAGAAVPLPANALKRLFAAPIIVPVVALGSFLASILAAEIHAPRHLLVFMPLLCFTAAWGLVVTVRALRVPPYGVCLVLAVLVGYQTYNALGLVAQYRNDIRADLARAVEALRVTPDDVVTFSDYSYIRGARLASDEELETSSVESPFIVTCNLEYARYLRATDASQAFHIRGGQARLEMFHRLFSGKGDYEVRTEVAKRPRTLEERLVAKGVLPDLDEFTSDRCVLFARR